MKSSTSTYKIFFYSSYELMRHICASSAIDQTVRSDRHIPPPSMILIFLSSFIQGSFP